uniref:GIY-YIG domain-containing protein n=1 Tax=viral metagenome TaxID=1070528 RepID=A0A6C0LHP7_9ZZZZ
MYGLIYRLFNHDDDEDERFYIGSSRDIIDRMYKHNNIRENSTKQKWFNEVDYENINYEILKEFDDISDIEVSRNALLRHKRRIHHVNIKYAL